MGIQSTFADLYQEAAFWDDTESQATQRSGKLWPGKQVVIAEPSREWSDLHSLYAMWCAERVTTANSPSVFQRLYSWMEDCQQTGITTGNLIFVLMEESAHIDDPRGFATWADLIDWSTSTPDEFIRAIELALSLELAALARELAQRGQRQFPDYEELEQAAQVLAPPAVQTRPDMAPAEGLDLSMIWLREQAGQYRGNWVAVRDGHLVAVAATLEELETAIGQTPDLESTLVTKVL